MFRRMAGRRTSQQRRQHAQRPVRHSLSSELLEARTMLAGDVHVSVSAGDLLIRGDSSGNQISVAPANDGGIEIRGLNDTRINGSLEPFVVFSDRSSVPDDLHVYLGQGSNQIVLSDIAVGDDIYLSGGRAEDVVYLDQVTAGDRIVIRPGSGDDRVNILGSADDQMTARDIYVYDTGGDNVIGVNHVRVSKDIYLRTSEGDDVIAAAAVQTGDDLRLYGSSGDDTLAIVDSMVEDDTTLETGSRYEYGHWKRDSTDQDTALILNSVHGDRASIYLGSDADAIGIRAVQIAGSVKLGAGSGDDKVGVSGSSFADHVTLNGGLGTDGLAAADNSFQREPVVKNFEDSFENFDTDAIVAELIDSGALLPKPKLGSITDIVVADDDFSTLEAAVIAAGLAGTLDAKGDFTVFAPTNAAFDALPDGTLEALLADPQGQLKDILLYHVLEDEVAAAEIVQLTSVETALGSRISVAVTPTGVVLNGTVNVTATDIFASNGVIHVIDAVLLPPDSITDIVVANDDFSTLETAVVAAGLAGTLDGEGDFTVFAPTNAAFDALPEGTLDALLADPTGQLKDILLYHVAGSELLASDIVQQLSVATLAGQPILVEVTAQGAVILNGNVNVISTDFFASNGVIHVIDAVLMPRPSITDIVVADDDFSTLETAVVAAGLAETLDGEGDFTVFAPTNEAFNELPEGTLDALLADPTGQLKDILLYHAAGDRLFASDIVQLTEVTTLLGETITVDLTSEGGVLLNGTVNVTATDIHASNGVIHVIDAVLLPPEAPAQTIAEIVAGDDNFETLLSALEATGLTDTLASEGSYTVFAPTDDAFDKLPRHMLSVLTRFAPDVLKSILLYHVLDTTLPSQELLQLDSVTTLLGRDLKVDVTANGVVLNDRVLVTVTDITASNGVIHVIDTVLWPSRHHR